MCSTVASVSDGKREGRQRRRKSKVQSDEAEKAEWQWKRWRRGGRDQEQVSHVGESNVKMDRK